MARKVETENSTEFRQCEKKKHRKASNYSVLYTKFVETISHGGLLHFQLYSRKIQICSKLQFIITFFVHSTFIFFLFFPFFKSSEHFSNIFQRSGGIIRGRPRLELNSTEVENDEQSHTRARVNQ